ncbi:MAG: HD-GYP domain-containing protein [Thermotaleaceae bacterium]
MLKLRVDYIKPGMKLARNVYDAEGQILLSAGLPFKKNYAQKLKNSGIQEIYVIAEDGICCDNAQHTINEISRVEAKKLVASTMGKVVLEKDIEIQRVFAMVENLLDELLSQKDILLNLTEIRTVDEYTFAHSVNVCILSLITGIAMGYSRDQLKTLGSGALLHDIGKILVPLEILNKPAPLTDEEYVIMKKHTQLGYEVLKKYPQIDEDIAIIALTHHERYDGKGYPIGLKAEKLHQYAKIVAISDVYDAMTSDRVYKEKLKPHQAIEYLIAMGNHQFDYEIVKVFTQHVASYPIGTIVLLSNGYRGAVLRIDKNFPHRPTVGYLYNTKGEKVASDQEVSLADYPTLTIVDVLENIE